MSSEEIRKVSSTGGEKGSKPERFDLLPPEALEKIARHYGVGAAKYDDHNWRRGYDWSLSFASLMRHANAFWSGEDIDEETGSPHMAAVAFHAMTLLVFMDEHRDFDDRYKKDDGGAAIVDRLLSELHPIGEVFTDELPTVDGFYEDKEGDIWELRTELEEDKGRWSVASDVFEGPVAWENRPLYWNNSELKAWRPFTRVVEPLPPMEF